MQHIFCAQVLMQQKKAHHLLDSLIIYPGKCSQPCGLQQNSNNNNNNKSYWRKLLKQRKMNLCAATLLSCKKSVRFSSIEAVPGHLKCPVSPCKKCNFYSMRVYWLVSVRNAQATGDHGLKFVFIAFAWATFLFNYFTNGHFIQFVCNRNYLTVI